LETFNCVQDKKRKILSGGISRLFRGQNRESELEIEQKRVFKNRLKGMHGKICSSKETVMVEEINPDAKKSAVNMTLLIRSIQHIEGNPDCFRRAMDFCEHLDCAWRKYCLGYEDE